MSQLELADCTWLPFVGFARLDSLQVTEGERGLRFSAWMTGLHGETLLWSLDLRLPAGQMQRVTICAPARTGH